MLIPHRNLLLLGGLWFGLGAASTFIPVLSLIWQGAGFLLLALAVVDALIARSAGISIEVQRRVPHALPVGVWQTVQLRLASRSRALRGQLFDRAPNAFRLETMPLQFDLRANASLRLSYRVFPSERGMHEFGLVEFRLDSPLRVWTVCGRAGTTETIRVYPDFAKVTQYALLATDNRLSQIGFLLKRRRGQGLEFQQLRDYREDDSPRQIDWKATALQHKLISREYDDERDQQIVFLLDCGQRMRAKDDELSHFDHALNAALLLAYVALRQGDAVGVATFAHPGPRYLPPRKALGTVNILLNGLFDLQPSLQAPDYVVASLRLSERLSKRSLIVVLTNLRDEDADTLRPALRHLGKRHVVMLASLTEALIETLRRRPLYSFDEALTHASALEYLSSRRRLVTGLRKSGVHVLDVTPAKLPIALVNHYWEMKRAGVL